MIVSYNGFEYEVEGEYIPKVLGRMYTANGDGWPDEPADYIVGNVILFDCDYEGNEIAVDVTSELFDDPDFIDACIDAYESGDEPDRLDWSEI
jgi:hypothetical protein